MRVGLRAVCGREFALKREWNRVRKGLSLKQQKTAVRETVCVCGVWVSACGCCGVRACVCVGAVVAGAQLRAFVLSCQEDLILR